MLFNANLIDRIVVAGLPYRSSAQGRLKAVVKFENEIAAAHDRLWTAMS